MEFYKDRFLQHKQSIERAKDKLQSGLLSFESSIKPRDQEKKKEYRKAYLDAIELIVKCRRLVAYTYPMAYFIEDAHERKFFEFLQSDLEYNLEKIDSLTDEDSFRDFFEENKHIIDSEKECAFYFEDLKKLYEIENRYFKNFNDELTKKSREGKSSVAKGEWYCPQCELKNSQDKPMCQNCDYDPLKEEESLYYGYDDYES